MNLYSKAMFRGTVPKSQCAETISNKIVKSHHCGLEKIDVPSLLDVAVSTYFGIY